MPRLYSVEIYETNERVQNITVSRIPCRLVWRERWLKCFEPVTQLDTAFGWKKRAVTWLSYRYNKDDAFIDSSHLLILR